MGKKDSEQKGFDISSLIPERISVETHAGTLYVRHRWTGDLRRIRSIRKEDGTLVGSIIRLYASHKKDGEDTPPLAKEVLLSLSDDDIKNILLAVAKHAGIKDIPDGIGADDLGALIEDNIKEEEGKYKKIFDDVRKKYEFLGSGVSSAFYDQVSRSAEMLKLVGGINADELDAYRRPQWLTDATKTRRSSQGLAADLETSTGRNNRHIERPIVGERAFNFRMPPNPLLEPIRDNAQSSREATKKLDALMQVIGGLNDVVIDTFLPTWMQQVKSSEAQTEEAISISREGVRLSRRGYYLAVIGVIVTAIVSAAIGVWQIMETRKAAQISADDERAVRNLERRLGSQRELIDRQSMEIQRLREQMGVEPSKIDGVVSA